MTSFAASMGKFRKYPFIAAAVLSVVCLCAPEAYAQKKSAHSSEGQNNTKRVDTQKNTKRVDTQKNTNKSGFMEYVVNDGDTIYVDAIRAAKVYEKLPRQKGKDWRKYYRLVYNFNKVYPYALEAKNLISQVDSTVLTDDLKRSKKEKYIKNVQSNLFDAYEDAARHMTVTQGALLMRLVDRECGLTSYDVIKDYRNGMAAGFWQGVAKIFGTDMRKHYDPEGQDADVEDLVQKWQDGDFDSFYYSLFWEYPSKTEIKSGVAKKSKRK